MYTRNLVTSPKKRKSDLAHPQLFFLVPKFGTTLAVEENEVLSWFWKKHNFGQLTERYSVARIARLLQMKWDDCRRRLRTVEQLGFVKQENDKWWIIPAAFDQQFERRDCEYRYQYFPMYFARPGTLRRKQNVIFWRLRNCTSATPAFLRRIGVSRYGMRKAGGVLDHLVRAGLIVKDGNYFVLSPAAVRWDMTVLNKFWQFFKSEKQENQKPRKPEIEEPRATEIAPAPIIAPTKIKEPEPELVAVGAGIHPDMSWLLDCEPNPDCGEWEDFDTWDHD